MLKLSYCPSLHTDASQGLTADTVTNFELVTAAGEIVNANRDENEDLFYALKGGGSQFAIVTEFTFQTYEVGSVWGGYKIYSLDQKEAVLNATHSLVSDYYDPKAAVIVTFSTTLDVLVETLVDIFVVFYFYNHGDGPGDILTEFDTIPSLIDATKSNRSYKDLIDSNSLFSVDGMRYLIRTGTLPNLPGDAGRDVYNHNFDSWYDLAQKYQESTLDNMIFSLAFQPISVQLANASASAPYGVNLLGLDPDYGDKFFMEYDVSWLLPTTDKAAASFLTEITQPAQDYATGKYSETKPTNWKSGDTSRTNFNPLFMNDAMYNQDPSRFYGEGTYEKLSGIQKERDPKGLFRERTGGFKFE